MNERISIDPAICHGQARVAGTRIPVHQIVHLLAGGDTLDDLLADYPSLTRADILACLDYAAILAENQVTPSSEAVAYESARERYLARAPAPLKSSGRYPGREELHERNVLR